jgi:vesicle transport protein SEC22
VYLTIAEKAYPRKLAFSYLDELSKEFERSYAGQRLMLRHTKTLSGC